MKSNFWLFLNEEKARLPVGCRAKVVYDPNFPLHYNTHLDYFRNLVGSEVTILEHYSGSNLMKVVWHGSLYMHFHSEELIFVE